MTPKDFRALLEPMAKAVEQKFFIPAEFMMAQAALETGWLKFPTKDCHTGKDSFNLFNIKWRTPADGESVEVLTSEYHNGKRVNEYAKFRAYKSYKESFADYAQFLMRNPRYHKALLAVKDPCQFAIEIGSAGYATDPKYAEKIISIMKQHFGVA